MFQSNRDGSRREFLGNALKFGAGTLLIGAAPAARAGEDVPSVPSGETPPWLGNLEDPVIWFSGGLYHVTVNCWSERKAFLLTSSNGVTHWTNRGLAYDPTSDFLRYTDGTVNHWDKIERPNVYLEKGHVVYFTFAVIDIPKEQDHGGEPHGSKVIVVPFDGAALDRDLQQ